MKRIRTSLMAPTTLCVQAGFSIPAAEPPLAPRLALVLLFGLLSALAFGASGCTILTYRGPAGERFTRTSLGAATSVSSLSVEAGTNGIRRVELQGYQNDSLQAFGAATEAAVRAALKAAQ